MRHAILFPSTEALTSKDRPAATRGPVRAAVLARLVWLVRLPGRIAVIRRDLALLGQMSDSELTDIGLNRQDVWDAAALPLGGEPGHLLSRRAAERRRAALSRR